ncbi:ribbon-helix-helix protein, CopG family [Sphingopyxis sp.]|uniref:ribbon-helix-helix protein, CopG family n=1 Tax=Sphingopyxis sp. TaxID=1908224 RepID=UPI002B48F9EF|nr:ribbon-helix-helix protein, CopG family [Sphingopyxis sp.]HJS10178.1 ribbon-helix-helix protein, CopG family [Sphingopyxis sp.]
MTTNKAVPLTITLDEADRAELDQLAKITERSLAHLAREAIREYLAKQRARLGKAS